MATERQVNMMRVKAQIAKTSMPEGAEKMNDQEIDNWIKTLPDKARVNPVKKVVPAPTVEEEEEEEEHEEPTYAEAHKNDFDGNNFGMAAKCVINAHYLLQKQGYRVASYKFKDAIIDDIVRYYELLQEARARVGSGSPSGEVSE